MQSNKLKLDLLINKKITQLITEKQNKRIEKYM